MSERRLSLKLYNTLTRRKDEFIPLNPEFVGIYVCGPTVYSDTHLGHAKSYISFDILVRYLRWRGYNVRYIQNITDVGHLLGTGEDRMLMGAKKEKLHPMELAEKYTHIYFDAMDSLNVQRPSISPRATGHIPEQIELVEILIKKGYAYEVDGSVYFDITKYPDYGKLSNRKIGEQMAGARVKVREEKRNPGDFALWIKASPEHIMKWKSPWSIGYPGWHIECSAMAMKYLGETIDIHGGGMENIFPHHECEIAQSESATGKQFVRYWLHNNMIMVNGVKMSKSLGNFITIPEILKKYSGEQIRFFILNSHYRSPVDFTASAIESAGEGIKRIHTTFKRLNGLIQTAQAGELDAVVGGGGTGFPDARDRCGVQPVVTLPILDEYKQKFIEAMDDDLNTPSALSVLFEFSHKINEYLDHTTPTKETVSAIIDVYDVLGDKVLGILPFSHPVSSTQYPVSSFIDLLAEVRTKLRTIKQWELADEIRVMLANSGIILEDTKDKTVWKYS